MRQNARQDRKRSLRNTGRILFIRSSKTAEQQNKPTTEPKKEPTNVQQQPKADSTVVVQPLKPERHEFVQRNKNDLPAGTYVIVGAFCSEANARKFSNEFIDMEYADANYGFITARNLWYVYMGYSKDVNEARKIRDTSRQEHNFKDAWILTVE